MSETQTAQYPELEVPFDKLGLRIGSTLHLEARDQSSRYLVKLIGYLPNHSIIVSAPVVDGKQVFLKQDRPFTVRSLAQNNAFAFQSAVKAVCMQPYPYIHLEYPRDMMTIQVRNAVRLDVDIPASVTSEFDMGTGEWPKSAVIYDLSKTGAGIYSQEKLGESGDEIVLKFPVQVAGIRKKFKLSALIRNRTLLEREFLPLKHSYGLQFTELSDSANIVLTCLLYELQADQ